MPVLSVTPKWRTFADVTLTVGTVNAGVAANVDITVTGAQVGMPVNAWLTTDMEAGVFLTQPPWVQAADTVRFRFFNSTAGNIVVAAKTANGTVG